MLDRLLTASELIAGGADPGPVLGEMLPEIVEQVLTDARAGGFAAWGESTVVDENTGEPVIPRPLFDELHRLAGLDSVWPVGNAGLLHVYGYLLSTAQTPFGGKRDRWTEGGVARALERAPEEFAPWFAAASTMLERVAGAIAPILAEPPPGALCIEEGPAPLARTVVVPGVLLYSVDGLLITAFPVSSFEPPTDPPRLRYNAVVGRARLPLAERTVRL